MKKKLWTLALAFCLVTAMLPGGVFHAERAWADITAEEQNTAGTEGVTRNGSENNSEHKHCICGAAHKSVGDHTTENEVTFKAWNDTEAKSQYNNADDVTAENSLPNVAGNYYLTDNVTLSTAVNYEGTRYCGWEAPDGVVLCLNGHSITMKNPQKTQEANKDVDVIKAAGHFTLTDCTAENAQGTITHAVNTTSKEKYKGKGVKVLGGTFDMYGGTITGNTSNYDIGGSGVSVEGVSDTSKASIFNLYGGTITGNTATSGGGVHVRRIVWYGSSEFYMYGGSITNNTVDSNNASYGTGGGVYVSWTSKFVMSGGEISGNTANKFGGGVYASALARSNAHDASDRTAEIVFSGTAKIKNNTVNSSVNNVYLDSSTTAFETVSAALTIQGSLEGQIGVTAGAAAPAIVATGADPVKNYGAIITSDDSRYEIVRPTNDDTVLMLNGKGASQPSLEHKHCVCGAAHESVGDHTTENEVAFTAWTDALAATQNGTDKTASNSLPTKGGNYYLEQDVTLSESWAPGDQTVLCLNGQSIKINNLSVKKYNDIIEVSGIYAENGKTLTLTDCTERGVITYIGNETSGRCGILTGQSATLNLHNIKVAKLPALSWGLYNQGTFNMYSGTFCENVISVQNYSTGTFNMYGGTVDQNTSIGVCNEGVMKVSGDVHIIDNSSNLYQSMQNAHLTVGELSDKAEIGLTPSKNPEAGKPIMVVTSGVTEESAKRFSSDNTDFELAYNGAGALLLKIKGEESSAIAPTITTQPTDLTITYGQSGSITVAATADADHTLSYQWYRNESKDNTRGTAIDGATAALYKIPSDTPIGTYYYYCVVTATRNAYQTTAQEITQLAALTVTQAQQSGSSSGGGYYTPSTDVTTSGNTDSKVTNSPAEVKNETRTDASGKQEAVAKVTVSAANQREILSQAKANKSKSIVIEVAKTAVRNGAKLELNLDKAFIQSILNDTEASLTIRIADGEKAISREKLKTLVAQTEGKTVTIDPEAVSPTDPAEPTDPEKPSDTLTPAQEKIVKGVENTNIDLRSQRTKNGNILLTWTKEKGYKVDYFEIYRSTKRSSGYGKKPFFRTPNGSWTKYLNTKNVKEGSTYYYRIRGVRVIDGKKYYTEYSTKAWRTI